MSNFMRNIGYRGVLCATVVVLAAAWSMTAEAAPKKAKVAKSAARVEQPANLNIEIYQRLPASQAKALQELVDRFNAQNPGSRLVLVDRDWRSGNTPGLLILEGDEEDAFLASKKPRYQPLFALMQKAGVALRTVKPQAMVTRDPVSAKGQLLALPVGLSTPVLYVNRAAFARERIEPNVRLTTWADVQAALVRLQQGGSRCPLTVAEPARVFIENQSAWNNVPALRGKQAVFNGLFHVKYLALMASWYRANLLHVFDDLAASEQRFAKGECALFIGPSSSWADFRAQNVEVDVTHLPYQDDSPGAPQNTLADGASLWAAAGKKTAEYKVVANFVSFWLQPDNQIAWQRATGFLPLNKAGILASDSNLLGDDLENIKVAISQLANRPTTPNSVSQAALERARARQVIDEELAEVWADRKATKAALDSAALRVSTGK